MVLQMSHQLSLCLCAVLDPNPTASALLAEQLLQQRAATEKWKRRARQLGQQLALAGAGKHGRRKLFTCCLNPTIGLDMLCLIKHMQTVVSSQSCSCPALC
jgi:hypothetical protein